MTGELNCGSWTPVFLGGVLGRGGMASKVFPLKACF